MRLMFMFLAFMFLLIAPAHAWEAKYPQAKIIAVEVYADWCPNCKILGPEFTKARSEGALDDLPVLFVKMNYTDKTTIHQSKLLGVNLGLTDFMKDNGAGTGYVALLDAASKKELTRFNRDSKAEGIIKIIKEKLGAQP